MPAPTPARVLALTLALTFTLAGCSAGRDHEEPGFFEKIFRKETYRLYRIDIQQGNAIDRQKLAKLEIGMNKKQVRYLLGNPVTENVFHKNLWQYNYYLIPGKGKTEKYRLTLLFDGDRLSEIRESKGLMERPRRKKDGSPGSPPRKRRAAQPQT